MFPDMNQSNISGILLAKISNAKIYHCKIWAVLYWQLLINGMDYLNLGLEDVLETPCYRTVPEKRFLHILLTQILILDLSNITKNICRKF